jgi:hypothetical protein
MEGGNADFVGAKICGIRGAVNSPTNYSAGFLHPGIRHEVKNGDLP